MLIKDMTFLKDSQRFKIDCREQKRVDLVLVKLIQPQHPKKIRTSIFFSNAAQKFFSLRHSKPSQFKKFCDRYVIFRGKTIIREIIFYGKSRPTPIVIPFCDKTIYGTARNPITKHPLFNVNIFLYPLQSSNPIVSTISNASGNYLIESIPVGVYQITASKPNYYIFRVNFTLEINQRFRKIDIQLLSKTNMHCQMESPRHKMEQKF
jgi:hypothetical protein